MSAQAGTHFIKIMKFSILDTINPHYNLAVEEYLFNTSDDEVFLLWQNSPTVVIGKNQNAYAEINKPLLEEKGVFLARRITGGGAVYHDEGNVNYSFISPSAKTDGIDFSYYVKPIIDALLKLGVKVSLSGRNDLVTSDGKKISGNAQHRVGNRVLHHGTLLFSSDLEFLSTVLNVDEEKLKSKAVKSTRSRVANVSTLIESDMSVDDFIAYISSHIITAYNPEIISIEENEEIVKLYERNKSIGWLYPERSMLSNYQITRKKRFNFGSVELDLYLKNDEILSLKISGDFFGVLPIEELENLFKNVSLSAVQTVLEGVNVSDYILGMTTFEFVSLLNG